jgi:hypothetical protein
MSDVARPPFRLLQGYALDPSLSQQLDTATVSTITFRVPWESLETGPVGEYLEVIDYDPAGRCFYAPVDLDDLYVLAQDGLPPSEGTPQFHQQMLYAVARLTIANFERALGRPALWSPGPPPAGAHPKDDSRFVQRLRIYPHALREANAYYSPAKKALLFGYFRAAEGDPADHVPGSIVFTCLSHDIVAHETTHALLDGLHRRLNEATNPDMLAFHEGFADLVALFQHFTFPEILAHQMSRTRGDIRSQENFLGQLATQFGRATGQRGALRDAIGTVDPSSGQWSPQEPDPAAYEQTMEPHERGAILVAAVFSAYLAIYTTRTSDLLRLYTGGTGVLPAGAIHPDLVRRLSTEASKVAKHVLTMCVRALDYCPPVDLTFGEYLRALITADLDAMPDDQFNYRIAFVEAFRRRGIFPRDVRAMSVDNLRWRRPSEDDQPPSPWFTKWVTSMREDAHRQQYAKSREEIFDRERETRGKIHEQLRKHFQSGEAGRTDAKFLGLNPKWSFEVQTAHFASRFGPNGVPSYQLVLQLTQTEPPAKSAKGQDQDGTRLSGGSTVIADLSEGAISYCIRKPLDSVTRRERQRAFLDHFAHTSLHATYFGVHGPSDSKEPFALLHRGGW